jgi:hypothetical protein
MVYSNRVDESELEVISYLFQCFPMYNQNFQTVTFLKFGKIINSHHTYNFV